MRRTFWVLILVLALVLAAAAVLHSLPDMHGASRVRAGADIRRAHTDNSLFESSRPRLPASERAPYDGQGSCRLSGIITDQGGHAVEDCPVSIEPGWGESPVFFLAPYPNAQPIVARTDVDGRYEIEGVAAGTWVVGPSAPSARESMRRAGAARPRGAEQDAIAAVGTPVSVTAGQTEMQLDLRVYRGLYIRGSICAASGPLHDCGFVHACRPGTNLNLNEMSDKHGAFVLGPLIPGRYSLVAHASGEYRESESVDASAGDEAVVLTLRPGGAIAGWVEDAATGDVCQAKLTLTEAATGATWTVSAWSHDSGDFGFDALPSGTYDICARTGERNVGFARSVKVREGDTTEDVRIRLEPGCVLRVRCAPEHSGVVTLASGGSVVASGFVEAGGVLVDVVPRGRVSVRLEGRAGVTPEDHELELSSGEERDVLLGEKRD